MAYYPAPKYDFEVKRARVLIRTEFLLAMKVAILTRQAKRNQLVLALSHGVGLRCTEMARLTISDVMNNSGVIRAEVTLRAATTKGNKVRVVPFSNKLLRDKLEAYLGHRIENRIGTDLFGSTHRGLVPHLALLYYDRKTPFQLSKKARRATNGEIVDYWACDTLERTIKQLYDDCGLRGAFSHSSQRTYASRVMEATGGDVDALARLLGHSDIYASESDVIFATKFHRTGHLARFYFVQPPNIMLVHI